MNAIGKEVCFLNTDKLHNRKGEGDFIRLNNGNIMFAYTEYENQGYEDNACANISAIFSYDDGETFRDYKIILKKDDHALNYACVNLIKLTDGGIALYCLRKYLSNDGELKSAIIRSISYDNAKTWSTPETVIDENKYYVLENGRILRLNNGNILLPLNLHEKNDFSNGKIAYFISTDDGKTFINTGNLISNPTGDPFGLQETGVCQFDDGTIFSYSRTNCSSQFQSFSYDNGLTWTTPYPKSNVFSSPLSPMTVKKTKDYFVAVFNPIPNFVGRINLTRSPLLLLTAKSGEDLLINPKPYYLETDETNSYCYTAVFSGNDYILFAYYHSNGKSTLGGGCKIKKVLLSELK